MRQAYSIAANKSKVRKAKDKDKRDKGACLGPHHIGDRVLVTNYIEHGCREKLRFYWENDSIRQQILQRRQLSV